MAVMGESCEVCGGAEQNETDRPLCLDWRSFSMQKNKI